MKQLGTACRAPTRPNHVPHPSSLTPRLGFILDPVHHQYPGGNRSDRSDRSDRTYVGGAVIEIGVLHKVSGPSEASGHEATGHGMPCPYLPVSRPSPLAPIPYPQ